MSTVNTAPPPTDVRRTVAIDFLFLDASTCERCQGTGANLDTALTAVEGVLQATGAEAEVRRIHVRSIEQARELRFVSSPTIRVNGRDIAPEMLQSECGADGCGCGPSTSCRLWSYRGRQYPVAPVGLIVDAVLSELYGGTMRTDSPAASYELPGNFARVLAAKDAGTSVGGGCCA
jgi:hypothetical protein